MSAEQLERGLKVMQERRSRIITVSFTSRSPRQAAVVANRIVQLYVDGQIERKRASMSVELARLGERIAEFKSEVKNAAAAAQSVIQQRSAGATTASRKGSNSDERMHELLREVAAGRAKQDSLQRRQKEIHDKLEFITPDVSIVSPASPPDRPSSFNPILFILPALIICAICASLLAVVLDRLDRGLRSERDINEALSIPCIGLVPQLPRTCTTRPFQYLLAEPFSAYAEAIRSVVVTLQMAAPPRAPKVLLVSSSVPMEGRTTLALSLAAYIAHLGRRVLLVDLDFRRGSILDELDGRAERGPLDLHLQNRPPAEFIQHIPDLGLDYLPMPRCRVDPLALFVREQTPRLLRQLRESYDCVIIDGPPLLGTAESRLLPSMADKLLFVVKWGTTRRDVAENALRLLRGAGSDKDSSELPTAILTRVDLKQHARYRFGDAGEFLVKYRNYYSPSMEA
jgi:capsular polysaccharide biosynthesis protein/MinD-like ATPase involved in chromosome partitioning or flagellar assembly